MYIKKRKKRKKQLGSNVQIKKEGADVHPPSCRPNPGRESPNPSVERSRCAIWPLHRKMNTLSQLYAGFWTLSGSWKFGMGVKTEIASIASWRDIREPARKIGNIKPPQKPEFLRPQSQFVPGHEWIGRLCIISILLSDICFLARHCFDVGVCLSSVITAECS